jgi:hypothetical protein
MLHRGILGAIGAAFVALGCTYDFDRFESPGAAGSGGSATAGSAESTAGKAGASSGGARSGSEGGASGDSELGGESGRGAAPGDGTGAGFSCEAVSGTGDGDHCYFAIAPDAGLSWAAARETCEGYSPSSHLLTIGSFAEQAAIDETFARAGSEYWIGLSLSDVEGAPDDACQESPERCPFEWVTGDALSYENWARHSKNEIEPNYTGACVRLQLDDFAWADFDCSSRLAALCEHGD